MQILTPFPSALVSSPVAVALQVDPTYQIGVGKHHLKRVKNGVASYVYTLKDSPKFEPGPHTLTYQLVDAAHVPVPGVAPASVSFTVVGGEAPTPPPTVEQQIRTSLKKPQPYGLGWTDAMVERLLR